jgi:hypothetical protein
MVFKWVIAMLLSPSGLGRPRAPPLARYEAPHAGRRAVQPVSAYETETMIRLCSACATTVGTIDRVRSLTHPNEACSIAPNRSFNEQSIYRIVYACYGSIVKKHEDDALGPNQLILHGAQREEDPRAHGGHS